MRPFIDLLRIAVAASLIATPGTAAFAQTAPSGETASAEETSAAPVAAPSPDASLAPSAEAAPTADATAAPTGPTIAYTSRQGPPTFVLTTAAQAGLGVIGALAAISEGKKLTSELQLVEPANDMSATFAASFAKSRSGRIVEKPLLIVEPKADLLKVNAAADQAQYIVDVGPAGINAIYFPLDWGHYGVVLTAGVRVFDATNGKLVFKGVCQSKPEKSPASPTKDELLANQGARLKAMISEASQKCTAQLEQKLLGS